MKFYCDNCNAKYLIGDDKVRGKILRIRCKRCSHVIVVREPTQPAQIASGAVAALAPTVAAAAAAAAEPQKTIEWYYAMAGRTYGPFTLDALRNMFATGQLGDEAYVWNETFTSWVPALERSEFAHYFASGAVRKPPRPTVALGAIDVEAIEKAKAAAQKQSSSTHSVLGAAGPRTAMGPPGRGFSGQPTTALGPPGALSGHRGGAEKKRDGVERQATALTAGGKSAKRDPSSAVSRAAPSGVSSFGSASSPSGVSSLGSVSSPSGVSSLGNASPGGVSSPSSVSRVPSRRSGVLPSSRASQVSNLSASSSTSRLSTISSTADVSTSERLRMLRERLSARQSGTMPQVSLKERLRQLRKQSDGGAPDRPGPSASVSRPEQHTRADEATRVQSVPPESLARMKTSLPSPAPSSTSSSQQHVFDDGYGSVGEDEPTISGQEASTLMADALAQMRGLEQAELLSDPNNQPPDTDLVSTPSFTATGGVFGAVEEDSSPSGLQPS
ncbi:MAG: GYF domain-containing protein, partial [Myxococcota bacterium]